MELAKEMDGEIVSADSMQVYKGMDIGTAKPSQADQLEIPHHLIDIRTIQESFKIVKIAHIFISIFMSAY